MNRGEIVFAVFGSSGGLEVLLGSASAGPVNNAADMLSDPHFQARGMFEQVNCVLALNDCSTKRYGLEQEIRIRRRSKPSGDLRQQ
eukprot:6191010-Amphidinium_carterae.1